MQTKPPKDSKFYSHIFGIQCIVCIYLQMGLKNMSAIKFGSKTAHLGLIKMAVRKDAGKLLTIDSSFLLYALVNQFGKVRV